LVGLALAEVPQIVAAAEALAGALHDDHVHLAAGLGPRHGGADLARGVVVDGVQALRAVQQQPRDARVGVVLVDAQGLVARHDVAPFEV